MKRNSLKIMVWALSMFLLNSMNFRQSYASTSFNLNFCTDPINVSDPTIGLYLKYQNGPFVTTAFPNPIVISASKGVQIPNNGFTCPTGVGNISNSVCETSAIIEFNSNVKPSNPHLAGLELFNTDSALLDPIFRGPISSFTLDQFHYWDANPANLYSYFQSGLYWRDWGKIIDILYDSSQPTIPPAFPSTPQWAKSLTGLADTQLTDHNVVKNQISIKLDVTLSTAGAPGGNYDLVLQAYDPTWQTFLPGSPAVPCVYAGLYHVYWVP